MHRADRPRGFDGARRWVPRPDPRAARRHPPGPAGARGLLVAGHPSGVGARRRANRSPSRSRRIGPWRRGSSRCTGAGPACRSCRTSTSDRRDRPPTWRWSRSMRRDKTCIFSDRGTDLIVDLVGWFGDGGSPFQEFAPRRAVDTREPTLRPPGVTGAACGRTSSSRSRAACSACPTRPTPSW